MKPITATIRFFVFLLILVLTVYQGATVSAAPVTVTDASGQELHFTDSPQRVVSLVPTAAEILFDLGGPAALLLGELGRDTPGLLHVDVARVGVFAVPTGEKTELTQCQMSAATTHAHRGQNHLFVGRCGGHRGGTLQDGHSGGDT